MPNIENTSTLSVLFAFHLFHGCGAQCFGRIQAIFLLECENYKGAASMHNKCLTRLRHPHLLTQGLSTRCSMFRSLYNQKDLKYICTAPMHFASALVVLSLSLPYQASSNIRFWKSSSISTTFQCSSSCRRFGNVLSPFT